jgi:hypothetical protein
MASICSSVNLVRLEMGRATLSATFPRTPVSPALPIALTFSRPLPPERLVSFISAPSPVLLIRTSSPYRLRVERLAGDFRRAVDFRAPVRLAVDFRLVPARLAVDFRRAVGRLAVVRFAVERFAVRRPAVDLRPVERFAVERLAVERRAVPRFAVVRLEAVLARRRPAVLARFAVLRARPVALLAVLLALRRAVVVVFLPRLTISFATFPACARTCSALVVMASAASRALSAARFAAPTAA